MAAIGHGLWLLGWWMVAREAAFSNQMSGTNVAIAGLVVVAYADASWLARSHRRIVERRRILLGRIDGAPPLPDGPAASMSVIAGPERGYYHRPGCRFAAGREWPTIPLAEVGAGQQPCGVCRP